VGGTKGCALLRNAEAVMVLCLFAGFISALCGIAVAMGLAE
jgi:hypothetical protein